MKKALTIFGALLLIASLALAVACGDDDDDDDPNIGQVGAVSENAAYAYTEDGPDGLFDYLAETTTSVCNQDAVRGALEDGIIPTGWRNTKDIDVSGDVATATVILITEEGDVEQEWAFIKEGDAWRISSIPGLEDCA